MERTIKMNPDVFTDASSAILLFKAGLLSLFLENYHLDLARSVFRELTQPGYPGADTFLELENRVRDVAESDVPASWLEPARSLDRGEKETIFLYAKTRHLPGKTNGFILVDDGPAARFCKTRDLAFINALLVPKLLCFSGQMNETACQESMDRLCRLGRYSDRIIRLAHGFSRTDLEYFIRKNPHE